MLKKILFQLHWLFGISAGLVLVLMGVTGASMSFEDELQRWLDPVGTHVQSRPTSVLPPAELVRRLESASGKKVVMLSVNLHENLLAKAMYAPPPGERRGASQYFDPYTAELRAAPLGDGFFNFMQMLHRFLSMGELGKQITHACTLILVFFCLSGLYLRWPKKVWDWRVWLTLKWARKGRSFNWDLHSVVGTWCLIMYLSASMTGLFWSYDWFRAGVNTVLNNPAPANEQRRPEGRGNRDGGRENRSTVAAPATVAIDLDLLWQSMRDNAGPTMSFYNLRLPQAPGQPVQVFYLLDDSPHDRAFNQLVLAVDDHAAQASMGLSESGSAANARATRHFSAESNAAPSMPGLRIVRHDRYAELRLQQQLVNSVYALHVGSYYGVLGRILMCLASLCMPVFFVTGWLLYLDRRRKKKQLRSARGQVSAQLDSDAPWLIAFASQSGFAERLAWQTAAQLQSGGQAVRVVALADISVDEWQAATRALLVLSTFGAGEAPDSARKFEREWLSHSMDLKHLHYAILGLGDRSYAHFCGFAQRIDAAFKAAGAQPLASLIEVDNADPMALQQWQRQWSAYSGASVLPFATPEPFGQWTLQARQSLNPGSVGSPVYKIVLANATAEAWQAGDIAQILPRNGAAAVEGFVQGLGMSADQSVTLSGLATTLAVALASRQLPESREHLLGLHAQALLDVLAPLAMREYSIASLPADGGIELLVRQERHADGRLGVGSGWLTEFAPLLTDIALRVRHNSGFHVPQEAEAPVILIGNGTGLAGLRSLLKARIANAASGASGAEQNWLIFGERNRAYDFFCATELQAWLAARSLEYLDVAFSRDQPNKVYVQDVLRTQAARLQEWVAAGAYIYVCGSLQGMAQGVEAALHEVLGVDELQRLIEAGRYRRDVY